jgi:exopolysaccharide/PEP-CTERM locus tyrosine autokinase
MGKFSKAFEKIRVDDRGSHAPAEKDLAGPENKRDLRKKKTPSIDFFKRTTSIHDVDKNLITLLKPHSFEAEQFKILRTNILFPKSGQPPRSIMVTSSVPGEGKSFVAANLAISIAQNINQHVLLIDCDMRRPCIHTRFGYNGASGLSDYLSKSTSLPSLLLKTPVKRLTILPGGSPPENPAELLSSEQMSQLLIEVRERYHDRYIVIDSPPPHLTAEARAIARQVDGIVLVIKCGMTKREVVSELIEMIGKDKILGIIFNWFNLNSAKYYGYGKYRYYKKYYGDTLNQN